MTHQKYYEKNPKGNHLDPSPMTQKFMDTQSLVNEKIYSKLDELKDSVGFIRETLVGISADIKTIYQFTEEMKAHKKEVEERLSKLENEHWWMKGVMAALGIAFAFFQFIFPFLRDK